MLQNPCKTLGFKKIMVYKIPPGGGGKPYPASGLLNRDLEIAVQATSALYSLLSTGLTKENPSRHT